MSVEAEVGLKKEEAEALLVEVQHLGAMNKLDSVKAILEETISGTEEEKPDLKTTPIGQTTHLEIPALGNDHLETLGKIRAMIGLAETVDGEADITTPLEEWILVLSTKEILEDQ